MDALIPEEYKDKVIEQIVLKMPDSELMDDLDVVQPSVSAPIGGKNAAKKDVALKRQRTLKGDRFTKTINKFMGIWNTKVAFKNLDVFN